jgi:DNA-directed RNA polymerase specialized sigma24 family protein
MNSREHEKISAEAYARLEPLLAGHYRKTYEESYQILKGKIEAKLRGKDTNAAYRPMLLDSLEDLVQIVLFRLASINDRLLRESGEPVRDPELMAYKITERVYSEELKKLQRRLNELPIDAPRPGQGPLPLPQPASSGVQAAIAEIIQDCYDACLEKMSAEARRLFLAYYPDTGLDPQELTARRKRLAFEEAGLTQAQAQRLTPAEEGRIVNNLQSKVNKLRKGHVEDCVRECTEAQKARDTRLSYLAQQ